MSLQRYKSTHDLLMVEILAELRGIRSMLRREGTHLSKQLDDLTAEVEATKTVEESAVTLIAGIADRVAAAGVDPAKLQALTDELKSESDALASAVAANTPAADVPAPTTDTSQGGAPTADAPVS